MLCQEGISARCNMTVDCNPRGGWGTNNSLQCGRSIYYKLTNCRGRTCTALFAIHYALQPRAREVVSPTNMTIFAEREERVSLPRFSEHVSVHMYICLSDTSSTCTSRDLVIQIMCSATCECFDVACREAVISCNHKVSWLAGVASLSISNMLTDGQLLHTVQVLTGGLKCAIYLFWVICRVSCLSDMWCLRRSHFVDYLCPGCVRLFGCLTLERAGSSCSALMMKYWPVPLNHFGMRRCTFQPLW